MSHSRIAKFERMLKYQTNQVDLLQQQISAQQILINVLHKDYQELCGQLQDLQAASSVSVNSVTAYQQCELVMIQSQRKIKAKKIEIATADEKLDFLLHSYRDEDRRLNAWKKLVDQEKLRAGASNRNLQQREADKLYLLTKERGDVR